MARTLVAFTENYRMGGGNRYLVDFVNSAAPEFDRVVVAANRGGIFPDDIAGLPDGTEFVDARFATAASAAAGGGPLGGIAARTVRLADPLAFSSNVRSLTKLFREVGADVVVAFNGGYPAARSNLAAVVAAREAGATPLLSVVGTPVPRRPKLASYEAGLDARVFDSAAAIVVNAHSIEGALVELRDAPTDKIAVVRNGIPDTTFVRDPGASSDAPVIGCISRVDAEKGALDLLEAFALIAAEFPTARLRLIGEGDARDTVLERAVARGLGGRVEAPGRSGGDVAALVAEFDIYAFASHHEGFPYAILEAMRAGCPLVTTGVGGVPEAVSDGVEGLVVPPSNPQALAAALRRMLSEPTLRESCSAAARERWAREFSLDAMRASVSELIGDVGV